MSESQGQYGTPWDDLPADEQQYAYWLAVRNCNRSGLGGLDYEVVYVARDVVGDIVWSVGLDAESTRHWRFLRRLDLPASAAEAMAQARREDVPETDFGNILTTPQT